MTDRPLVAVVGTGGTIWAANFAGVLVLSHAQVS
jgi:hypothetical protein